MNPEQLERAIRDAATIPAGADPSRFARWYRKGYRASSRVPRKDLGHYDDLYADAHQIDLTAFYDGWDDAAAGVPAKFTNGKWGKV